MPVGLEDVQRAGDLMIECLESPPGDPPDSAYAGSKGVGGWLREAIDQYADRVDAARDAYTADVADFIVEHRPAMEHSIRVRGRVIPARTAIESGLWISGYMLELLRIAFDALPLSLRKPSRNHPIFGGGAMAPRQAQQHYTAAFGRGGYIADLRQAMSVHVGRVRHEIAASSSPTRPSHPTRPVSLKGAGSKAVQVALREMLLRGESFTSQPALAESLDVSPSTIHKAIHADQDLRRWAGVDGDGDRGTRPSGQKQGEGAITIQHTSQRQEADPSIVEPTEDEVKATVARLIEAASPSGRAKLHAMSDPEQWELARTALRSPDFDLDRLKSH